MRLLAFGFERLKRKISENGDDEREIEIKMPLVPLHSDKPSETVETSHSISKLSNNGKAGRTLGNFFASFDSERRYKSVTLFRELMMRRYLRA